MSDTFSYEFMQGTTEDVITVTVSTPATDSTGYGSGYAVTSIAGFIGTTPITGESGVAPTSSSSASGDGGSSSGLVGNGIEFNVGGQTYVLASDVQEFLLGPIDGDLPLATLVSTDAPCFCRGTRILTPRGEVPVEQLRIGDLVTTLAGEAKPLTSIGSGRSLVTPANPDMRPIVVCAGALAGSVPTRNLHLTKGRSRSRSTRRHGRC